MEFKDIIYQKEDGVAKVTINRPEVYNAFRTQTVKEMVLALEDAALDPAIGVVVLTGAGDKAFCTGHDVREPKGSGGSTAKERVFLHSRLQKLIRENPKPVIAAVNGWCIGGGNVFCTLCDLAIAAETAKFGQVGPKMGSFAAGFGTSLLARTVGEKKAREIWFLCRQYTASEALNMGWSIRWCLLTSYRMKLLAGVAKCYSLARQRSDFSRLPSTRTQIMFSGLTSSLWPGWNYTGGLKKPPSGDRLLPRREHLTGAGSTARHNQRDETGENRLNERLVTFWEECEDWRES